MARWPNGGPNRLYVVIRNKDAEVFSFENRIKRTEWVKKHYKSYSASDLTFLRYIQERVSE